VFFAGFSGAVLGLVVCLALGGLYVILRYIGEYLFYAGLTLILLSGLYLYVRRPADARRLRRFLADQGRALIDWLWGRLRRADQVNYFLILLGQLLKFALNLNTIYTLIYFLI
jgi:hypothetical protein